MQQLPKFLLQMQVSSYLGLLSQRRQSQQMPKTERAPKLTEAKEWRQTAIAFR